MNCYSEPDRPPPFALAASSNRIQDSGFAATRFQIAPAELRFAHRLTTTREIAERWLWLLLGDIQLPEAFGTTIPSKPACLAFLELLLAQAGRPGRRPNPGRPLAAAILATVSQRLGVELKEPGGSGLSERKSPLVDLLRTLQETWDLRLISLRSGAAWRALISDARAKMTFDGAMIP